MLRAELKRILKTRSAWCLAAIALLICLSSALSTVRQVVKYVDGGGHTEIVRGISVYEENRQRYSVIRGEVTPELFASAVALHHELLELYEMCIRDRIWPACLKLYMRTAPSSP